MKQVLGIDVRPTEVKMRVLDIPPIDMTDGHKSAPAAVVIQAVEAKTPRRKAGKAAVSKHDRPARPKAASSDRAPSRSEQSPKRDHDGSVGRETFRAVEALVKQGRSKTAAFEQIAAETGRKVGAVSANYYRLARASGAVQPGKRPENAATAAGGRRRRVAPGSGRPSRRVNSANEASVVDQIVGQLSATVQALTEAVKAQTAAVRAQGLDLMGAQPLG
jgi:hypothetical protein